MLSFLIELFYKVCKGNRGERRVIFESKSFVGRNCLFEGMNRVCRFSHISQSSLGYATYVGKSSTLVRTIVGRYTCIGPRVVVTSGFHPTKRFVSIHPAFYSTHKRCGFTYVRNDKYSEYVNEKEKYSVRIGNDVWIADSVLILEGVHIGDGAVIAAGAVVTEDVPNYAIVAGVPAKILRYRFAKEDIDFLEGLQWWDKDIEWIKQYSEFFDDIHMLKTKLENK